MATDIQETSTDEGAIEDAARQARKDTPAEDARRWLIEVNNATLCTTSTNSFVDGFPFGSVVPFSFDAQLRPVIYTARIAAHTRNLKHDNRASLFVREPGLTEDPQDGWRITVMGRFFRLVEEHVSVKEGEPVERVSREEIAEIRARYVERVPGAWKYDETHSFSFWRMKEIERVRYIGGFGKICWLKGAEVMLPEEDEVFAGAARGAVEHMNEDHRENMVEMVRGLSGFEVESVQMLSLDRSGVTLVTEGPARRVRLSFGKLIEASEIRGMVIALLQRARG